MYAHRWDAAIDVVEARRIEEARPELRLELIDGAIYSMGRASPWHAAMTAAVVGELRAQLAGSPCRAMSESLAVGASADDPTYLHPDVTVLCGPSARHPKEPSVVLNPRAVVEVLSPGTEGRDRLVKLDKYKSIPSVDTIVHVEQQSRRIRAWRRVDEGWLELERTSGSLTLTALGVTLDVDALYAEAAAEDGGPEG